MTDLARRERVALCDTLLALGPDAPTLCGSWTTAQLAAHLVVREGRPDLSAGIVVPALKHRTEAAMTQLIARCSYPELVEKVRTGPPIWHPTRLRPVDEAANLVEMYIHHEDARRGGGDTDPRELSPALSAALDARLTRMAGLLLRPVRGEVDVQLVTDRSRKRIGSGHPVVEVHGRAGEVLLFTFGRQDVAQVELVGDEAAVATLRQAQLGI